MLHTRRMNIPRYWARAKKEVSNAKGLHFDLAAWGWSGEDRGEAERKAEDRLSLLIARVQQGFELDRGYAYGSRPLREEIIDEFPGDDLQAIVTRNSYGSLVLNTAQMMFIDVDFPKTEDGGGFFSKLFGKEKAPDPDTPVVARIRESLKKSSDSSFRIYRTAAGLRILATDRLYEPASAETDEIMRSVGVDPAFLQLCRIQKSFRARLTPKPWRCDIELPPGTYPREDREQRQRFSGWLTRYEQACGSKATCRFLEGVGRDRVHEQIEPLLKLHDRKTRVSETLPLA